MRSTLLSFMGLLPINIRFTLSVKCFLASRYMHFQRAFFTLDVF